MLAFIKSLFSRRPATPPEPPEPPDPDTLPQEQWLAASQARIDAGLKPFPSRDDRDYFNMVNGVCSHCGSKIYGGHAISYGYTPDKEPDVRCFRHFDLTDEGTSNAAS